MSDLWYRGESTVAQHPGREATYTILATACISRTVATSLHSMPTLESCTEVDSEECWK